MPKYKKGDIIKGKVTGIEKYGFFLAIDDDYTGLVHISEMSDKFVKNVFDYVQLEEVICSRVLDVDDETRQIKLSIKNLDYRINDKKELEDKNGFTLLRENLPIWISEYKRKREN